MQNKKRVTPVEKTTWNRTPRKTKFTKPDSQSKQTKDGFKEALELAQKRLNKKGRL